MKLNFEHNFLKSYILPIIGFIVLVLMWQLVVKIWGISKIILPAPSNVIRVLIDDGLTLLKNSAHTIRIAVTGFLISLLISFILATIFHFSKTLKSLFFPIAVSTRAIPIIAIAPITVLWFGTGSLSKVVLAATVAFFPILVNLMKGLIDFDSEEIELLSTFTNNEWHIFFKVRIPNSLPLLFAGLKIASSYAILGTIVAEFMGSQTGIGYIIKSSTYYSNTSLTFSAIIFSAMCGLLFYSLIAFIQRKLVFWEIEG